MEKGKKGWTRELKKKKKDTPTHFPIQWSFRKCLWQEKLSNTSSYSDLTFCKKLHGRYMKTKQKVRHKSSFLSFFFLHVQIHIQIRLPQFTPEATNPGFSDFSLKPASNFEHKDCRNYSAQIKYLAYSSNRRTYKKNITDAVTFSNTDKNRLNNLKIPTRWR